MSGQKTVNLKVIFNKKIKKLNFAETDKFVLNDYSSSVAWLFLREQCTVALFKTANESKIIEAIENEHNTVLVWKWHCWLTSVLLKIVLRECTVTDVI